MSQRPRYQNFITYPINKALNKNLDTAGTNFKTHFSPLQHQQHLTFSSESGRDFFLVATGVAWLLVAPAHLEVEATYVYSGKACDTDNIYLLVDDGTHTQTAHDTSYTCMPV